MLCCVSFKAIKYGLDLKGETKVIVRIFLLIFGHNFFYIIYSKKVESIGYLVEFAVMDKVSLGCFEALINCLLWRVLLWKQRTYRPRRSCLKKCYVHPFFVMFADFLVRLRSMWVVQCCWQAWCPAFVQIEIIHTLPWRNWAEILWSWKKEDCNHHHLMAFCRFEIPRRWSNHFLLSSLTSSKSQN